MRITLLGIVALGAIVIALTLAPLYFGSYGMGILLLCFVYAIWGMSWDFFTGLTGRENFGYQMFVGVAAYVTAYMWQHNVGDVWVGFAAGVAAAMLLALFVGAITLRLRGPYFALATLAGAIIVEELVIINWQITGGEEGISGLDPLFWSETNAYYVVALSTIVTWLILSGLKNSRFGTVLRAIKGDENGCVAAGVNVTRYKVLALLVSAMFAGIGASLYVGFQGQVGPHIMSVATLIMIISIAYVGGLGSVYGGFGAAFLLVYLGEALRSLGEYRLLLYLLLLLGVIFYLNRGLVSTAWERYGIQVRGGRDG